MEVRMTWARIRFTLAMTCMTLLAASSASAQVFGTFSWQMQPYCNVVTLTITQIQAGYTVDGFDEQCGALKRASAVGMALINPDGTVGIDFTIVTAPGGKGVHVAAVVSPVTGSGSWTDSVGNSGTFVLAGAVPALPPRPLPASGVGPATITAIEIAAAAVGTAQINNAQVQARVTGTCPAGQAVSAINANGTVVCASTQAVVQFRVEGQTTGQALPSGVRTDILWNVIVFNEGGGTYNAATGVYTVPTSGLYQVTCTGATSVVLAPGANTYRFVTLHVNNAIVQQAADEASDTFQNVPLVSVRKLNAGDQVKISMIHNLGAGITTHGTEANFTHFSVVQLR
jgi:hypothetical protein